MLGFNLHGGREKNASTATPWAEAFRPLPRAGPRGTHCVCLGKMIVAVLRSQGF